MRYFRLPPNLAHKKLIYLPSYVASSRPRSVLNFKRQLFEKLDVRRIFLRVLRRMCSYILLAGFPNPSQLHNNRQFIAKWSSIHVCRWTGDYRAVATGLGSQRARYRSTPYLRLSWSQFWADRWIIGKFTALRVKMDPFSCSQPLLLI